MILWLDAQLSPALASWLQRHLGIDAVPVRDLGLRDAEDADIFVQARRAGAVVMTKDGDFVELLMRLGPPPSVIWLRSGNTSNAPLQRLLARVLPSILEMLAAGEALVEIHDSR